MARGGARPGAGRKKLVINWRGPLLVDIATVSPKAFLLAVMRDEDAPIEVRIDAAKSVAPYVHARPAAPKADQASFGDLDGAGDDWAEDLGGSAVTH